MPQLDLENPGAWPPRLRLFLDQHRDLFLAWETSTWQATGRPVGDYDAVVEALCAELRRYSLVGWHSTRLTDGEICAIRDRGLVPLSETLLHARIDAVLRDGLIDAKTAALLGSKHQAGNWNREGRLWFCFFTPATARQDGLERFFRCWGGEALCVEHERTPEIAEILGRLGRPAVIEAVVEVGALESHHYSLAGKIARRYLIHTGFATSEPVDFEGCSMSPIAAQAIRNIWLYPGEEFERLTGCSSWNPPLTI